MQNRLYFSSEDIAEALINAGFDLRPEDCLTTKFLHVANELGDKARSRMRRELEAFGATVLSPTPAHHKWGTIRHKGDQ